MTLSIAFAAAEVTPFAKTGGLADVAASLPRYLESRGHDVRLFMPLHAQVDVERWGLVPVDFIRGVPITLGAHRFEISARVGRLPDSELDVYFVDCPALFHRDALYTGGGDEPLRFGLFCRALFELCQRMGWAPQILHANDWHTGFAPLYLRTLYAWDQQLFGATKSLLTIHNLAYQGIFPAAVAGDLLPGEHHGLLHQEDLAAGRVSFLKTGLLYAELVTTVSRTYADEIRTPELGEGLDGVLRDRGAGVVGIVNGIDAGEWDPLTDPHLVRPYGPADVEAGKRENKTHLLRELGLPPVGDAVPVLGIVSRLTPQKGFELVFEPLAQALRHLDLRLTVLGSGERHYEERFQELQRSFPHKVCFYRGYHDQLAHWIEAGADLFLMPSRFEPCGLNQMYSLRYGTVPLVRKTGGLADTVEPYDREAGTGTGFVFETFDKAGFAWALEQALLAFRDRDAWQGLVARGMQQDFSWERQGAQYEALYSALIE